MKRGDTVVILAGPYTRWYEAELVKRPYQLKGKYRKYSEVDQKWIDDYSPSNLDLYESWTVKFIDSRGAVQIGNFIVPGAVLVVLEKAA